MMRLVVVLLGARPLETEKRILVAAAVWLSRAVEMKPSVVALATCQ